MERCVPLYGVKIGVNILTPHTSSVQSGIKARCKSRCLLKAGSPRWTFVIVAAQLTCCYKKKKKKSPQMCFENSLTHCGFSQMVVASACSFQNSRHLGFMGQTRQLLFNDWGLIGNCFSTNHVRGDCCLQNCLGPPYFSLSGPVASHRWGNFRYSWLWCAHSDGDFRCTFPRQLTFLVLFFPPYWNSFRRSSSIY